MIVDTVNELSIEGWVETFPPKYLKIIAKELEVFVWGRLSEWRRGFVAGRYTAGCKIVDADIEAINQLHISFSVEQYFTYREIILNEKIRVQIENCNNNFLNDFDRTFRISYDNSNTNHIRLFDNVSRTVNGSRLWDSNISRYVIFLFRITVANNRKLKGIKNE